MDKESCECSSLMPATCICDNRENEEVLERRYMSEPVTQLLNKNHAPMIIRKYQGYGWPLFVAMICDANLSNLDDIVMSYVASCDKEQLKTIQDLRNFCGNLSEEIVDYYNDNFKYGCVEGIGIIAYWDKCLCSSLYGDHMTHGQCRLELFTLLNMMTQM